MDVEEKIKALMNFRNEKQRISFDADYQEIFSDEGARKSKFILETLATRPDVKNEDLDKYVFVSIGGADGSEAEQILRETRVGVAILVDISDEACEKARKKREKIKEETGKDLIVMQGDVTQRLEDVVRQLEDHKIRLKKSGLILSAQAVLHELPRRSPNFTESIFFGSLFRVYENNMFFGREPIRTERWPSRVQVRIGNASSDSLFALAEIINDRLSITNEAIAPVANGYVSLNSILALELIHKVIRTKSVSEFAHEIGEQLTSVQPDLLRKKIEFYLGAGKVSIETTNPGGFWMLGENTMSVQKMRRDMTYPSQQPTQSLSEFP